MSESLSKLALSFDDKKDRLLLLQNAKEGITSRSIMTLRVCKQLWHASSRPLSKELWFAKVKCGRSRAY